MKNHAFTLIELLVVVLIIGILSAIALPQYQKAVAKSHVMQLITAAKTISDAQKVFYLQNGVYAEKTADLGDYFPTESETYYRVGKGNCGLSYSNQKSAPRVSCILDKPVRVVIQREYNRDKLTCCSYLTDNYAGDSVCKAVRETSSWYNACSTQNPCHCY